MAAADFHKVKRLNGLEAWRRIVVPLKPRSEAKRNALHTAVHAPPKSRSLTSIINDLDDWEKVVEEFELCGGVITESDRRAVLLKKLPPGVYSSLVSSLRRCKSYREMKSGLRDEITFMKDWGLDSKSGSAHLASEQVPAQEALAAAEAEDEDEEGVITLDLSGVFRGAGRRACGCSAVLRTARAPSISPRRPETLPEGQGQGKTGHAATHT